MWVIIFLIFLALVILIGTLWAFDEVEGGVSIVGVLTFIGVMIALCIISTNYCQAGVEVKILNKEYSTEFTTDDYFFSKKTIDAYVHKGDVK